MKKNLTRNSTIKSGMLTKLLITMKLTLILIFIGTLNLNASLFSQDKTFRVKKENAPLREVFTDIENQSEYRFFYNDVLSDVDREVTIDANSNNIEDVLAQALDNSDLSYMVMSTNLILISPKKLLQQITVQGVVRDIDGIPIPGVNVFEENTTNGVVTDLDGEYSIIVSSEEAVLVYSYLGYLSETITVGSQTTIDITLVPDLLELDEIVVVGYGSMKKSDVTGAMISVSSADIEKTPVTNAFQALQGRAAGVDITSNERPGEVGKIYIRGTRSLTATSEPLYVVDGIPLMSSSAIETLNPRDIESIDILKDASAAAIYGSRGANGVIIITTKKGEAGKFSLNYSGTVTTENIVDKSPIMNASDYITWRRWAYHNMDPETYPRGDQPDYDIDEEIFYGSDDPYAWANIENGWNGGAWDGSRVKSTNWTDFVTRTGITHEHSLSASGGTDQLQAYASIGYLDQQGTQLGQYYERYTTKLGIDITPKDWIKMGISINAAKSDQDYGMSTLGASSSSGPNDIYNAAKRIYSYAVPYDDSEEEERIIHPGAEDNVYTIIGEEEQSTRQREMLRALASFYSQLDLGKIFTPLEGLQYRINFGPDFRSWREGIYIDANSVNRLGGTSYARLKNRRDFSWTLDNLITYDKEVGDHAFTATMLQTASAWNYGTSEISGQNIDNPDYLWHAFGTLDPSSEDAAVKIGSGLTERQLTSYMGRLNYSLQDKYLLTMSGRWDGASQLAEGNKWAFFPSAAIGWRISEETFMQNINLVDQLKLRLGYGRTGNSGVAPYSIQGGIQSFWVPFGGADNLLGYSINEPNYTSTQIPMPNKNLGWETTTQYNFGIDFAVLNNRMSGTIDLYKSNTTDLIMDMIIPIVTGYKSTFANVGETKNKGIDITINAHIIKAKDFLWKTNISAAWQKNEIVELAYGKNDMIDNKWFIGESTSIYYDIDQSGYWTDADTALMNLYNANGHDFEIGKVRPVDQNNDTLIDNEDRVLQGNLMPRWTFGFNNTFSYKGFDLDIIIFGRLGYTYNTNGEGQLGRYNQREIDYWTPDNTDSDYQKPIYNEAGGDQYSGLLGYMSGSFIKVRTISLGYNFPSSVTSKLNIQNLKAYVQLKNPGTLYSSIDFLDMDTQSAIFNRGLVFGVNVGF